MAITYSIGEFSGPIEVLLQMIESEKLPISEVSLLKVTEQYLHYVKSLPRFDADSVSRFLAIAATLLSIKAYSLLPIPDLEEEVEADIHELELRLKMYSALREASKSLEVFYKKALPLYSRDSSWRSLKTFVPDDSISLFALQESLQELVSKNTELLKLDSQEKLPEVRIKSSKTIEEVMDSISKRIQSGNPFSLRASHSTSTPAERAEALISFLAILELVRNGLISAVQEDYSSDITIPHNLTA